MVVVGLGVERRRGFLSIRRDGPCPSLQDYRYGVGSANAGPPSASLAHLWSRLRLLKVSLANLVLRNANLTNEISVLRRLVAHYELSTGQDMMALMKWFADQLQQPGAPAAHQAQSYLPGTNSPVAGNHDNQGTLPTLRDGSQGAAGASNVGGQLDSELQSRVYGPIGSILSRLSRGSPYYPGHPDYQRQDAQQAHLLSANLTREMREAMGAIQRQVGELRRLAHAQMEQERREGRNNRMQVQEAIRSLSNHTRNIEVRLEEQTRNHVFGDGSGRREAVSYSEYEILQHQKEELEMQNRRLVERISKLKYILKVASHQKNTRLEGIFQLFSREMEKLSYKVRAIIARYQSLRRRHRSFTGYARDFSRRVRGLVGPLQAAINRVVQDVKIKAAMPVDDRFRLYNLSAALGMVDDFGRNVTDGYSNSQQQQQQQHYDKSSRYGNGPVELMNAGGGGGVAQNPVQRQRTGDVIPEVDIAPPDEEADGKSLIDPSVYSALKADLKGARRLPPQPPLPHGPIGPMPPPPKKDPYGKSLMALVKAGGKSRRSYSSGILPARRDGDIPSSSSSYQRHHPLNPAGGGGEPLKALLHPLPPLPPAAALPPRHQDPLKVMPGSDRIPAGQQHHQQQPGSHRGVPSYQAPGHHPAAKPSPYVDGLGALKAALQT